MYITSLGDQWIVIHEESRLGGLTVSGYDQKDVEICAKPYKPVLILLLWVTVT